MNKEFLIQKYLVNELSYQDIGNIVNKSAPTIYYWRLKNTIYHQEKQQIGIGTD